MAKWPLLFWILPVPISHTLFCDGRNEHLAVPGGRLLPVGLTHFQLSCRRDSEKDTRSKKRKTPQTSIEPGGQVWTDHLRVSCCVGLAPQEK